MNQIEFVVGHKTKSNLPDGFFDKIVIRETFHHFSEKDKMLKDIYFKLKPDGEVIVYESSVDSTEYSEQCRAFILDKQSIIKYFEQNKYVLDSETEIIGNPGNVPPWHTLPPDEREDKIVLIFKKSGAN